MFITLQTYIIHIFESLTGGHSRHTFTGVLCQVEDVAQSKAGRDGSVLYTLDLTYGARLCQFETDAIIFSQSDANAVNSKWLKKEKEKMCLQAYCYLVAANSDRARKPSLKSKHNGQGYSF